MPILLFIRRIKEIWRETNEPSWFFFSKPARLKEDTSLGKSGLQANDLAIRWYLSRKHASSLPRHELPQVGNHRLIVDVITKSIKLVLVLSETYQNWVGWQTSCFLTKTDREMLSKQSDTSSSNRRSDRTRCYGTDHSSSGRAAVSLKGKKVSLWVHRLLNKHRISFWRVGMSTQLDGLGAIFSSPTTFVCSRGPSKVVSKVNCERKYELL